MVLALLALAATGCMLVGKPDDPFSYKIKPKQAPWLKTELQLELLDGCDCGNWVPKGKQVVQPGQREVEWGSISMSQHWGKDVGGTICKFRVKDLQNNKLLGPFQGPWVVTAESLARQNLEGYNAAMKFADYGVVLAREPAQGKSPIFLAGFKELSLEEVRHLDSIVQDAATSSSTLDPAVKEALKELLGIDPRLLSQWFLSLAEADLQGQFDQVYAQLLPEGLDRLEQVFLTLKAADPKQSIRVTAQQYHGIVKAGVKAQGSEGSDQELEEALKNALALVTALIEWLRELLAGLNEQVIREFGASLGAAIARVWDWYSSKDKIKEFTSQAIMVSRIAGAQYATNLNKLARVLGEFTNLLNWGVGGRLDQLLGTIEVLKNAIVTAGWKFLGVWVEGEYAGAMVQKEIGDQTFSGLILGDQSANPDIEQIINWVDWALGKSTGWWYDRGDLALGKMPDIDIVGVVFTKPGDRSSIANALENSFGSDSRFDRDTAVFVVWTAEDGTVWYDCIGPACAQIPEDVKKQIACDLAGGCPNGVQEYNAGGGTQGSSSIIIGGPGGGGGGGGPRGNADPQPLPVSIGGS